MGPLLGLGGDAQLPGTGRSARRSAGALVGPDGLDDLQLLVGDRAAVGEGMELQRSRTRPANHPTPMPNNTRPPDRTSIVATALAVATGCRYGRTRTPVPTLHPLGARRQVGQDAEAVPPLERRVLAPAELVGGVRVDGAEAVGEGDVIDGP